MASLIDMAADRGAFIDQSQSLNLFMESPNIGQLSSMYFYAWKKQLKTTYYLRSRPATRIAQTAAAQASAAILQPPAPVAIPERIEPEPIAMTLPMVMPEALPVLEYTDADAIACSLENPESCEACQ